MRIKTYATCLVISAALVACDDSGPNRPLDGFNNPDASSDGSVVSGNLAPPGVCSTPFPAFGCDGNPIGEWELVGICFETYGDCPGASVGITGSLQATLSIIGNGSYSHGYDLDYERRISVPQSCLDGRSCDAIGCFGNDHCSCTNGIGNSGSTGGDWTMDEPGRVRLAGEGLDDFCAGDEFADSNSFGTRRIWRRVSELCVDDGSCDDGLACTQDYCAADIGGCANVPVPTGGPEGWLTDAVCQNGLDDDCDGLVDAEDPDCLTEPCTAAGDCTDDGNPCTVTTCDAEGFCRTNDAPDGTTCPGSDSCTDTYICRRDSCVPGPATLDSDGDGFIDAACQFGSDCDDGAGDVHFGAEGPRGDASCSDGVDNDCDGVADVHDADCWEENCTVDGWCLEHPRPLSDNLNGLWAPAPDDIWAVADHGLVAHWDGTGWTRSTTPSFFAFEDVCGCGPNDGWAVSLTGDVFHYDGMGWTEVDSGNGGPSRYWGVDCLCDAMNLTQEVWAVGTSGEYSIYNGVSWTHGDHPTVTGDLNKVWVNGPLDAWVAGEDGAISHFEAGNWQDYPTGETADLHAIWGAAANLVWAAGVANTFRVFDGMAWAPTPAPGSGNQYYDIWGLADQLWLAGTGLYTHDQTFDEWTRHDFGMDPPTFRAVRSFGLQDTWAVGDAGAIVHVDDQGTLAKNYLTTASLVSVCGTEGAGGSKRIWAVGTTEEGYFLRDDGGWQMVAANMDDRMNDLYCAGSYGVFAVGGESWMRWGDGIIEGGTVPDIDTADDLIAVDGRIGPNGVELIAVGDDTLIAYYDGESWSTEYLSTSAFGEFDDVWISPDPQSPIQAVTVGYNGTCWLYDGTEWTSCELGSGDNLNGVWGDGAGAIWLVGDDGQLWSWNGASFDAIDIGQDRELLHDVAATGPNDIWVLGQDHVWIYNGSTWTQEVNDLAWPTELYVTSEEAWAVGRNGAILRRVR